MKNLFKLLLVAIMCLGLTACGGSNSSEVAELKARIETLEKQVEANSKTTITTEELRTVWAEDFKKVGADVSNYEVDGNYIVLQKGDGIDAVIRYELIDGNLYITTSMKGYKFYKK